MKTIKYILFLSILLIFSVVANALPIPTTWTGTIDKGQCMSTGSTFTFALDAYTPGIDFISSATLNIDLLGGGRGEINIDNIQNQKFTLTANSYKNSPAPVPEPATMLLLGSGFIGLAFYVRMRMKG